MMNKRAFLLACALAVSTFVGGAAAQEKERAVAVGVFTTVPPMSYVDNGKYTGLSNDILQRVAELENLKLDYQPMKFDALIPAIQAGQIDMGVAGIFVTEARKKVVDFSNPYHTQGAVLVAPVNGKIAGIADLKGKTIAAEQGSAALAIANRHADEWGVTVRVLQDAANMQLAMKTGDVDAMIYDSGVMAYQVRQEGKSPTIKIISDIIDPTGIAFAFPKGSDLTAVINAGMAKMEAAGEIAKIKQKYQLD